MLKIIIRIISIFVIYVLVSFIPNLNPDKDTMGTLYTVAGIMFSIGMSLIVTYNLSNIKNKDYLRIIRKNLKKIQNLFIAYFTIATISYLSILYLITNEIDYLVLFTFKSGAKCLLRFNILFLLILLFSILYFVINMISLQRLNDRIHDKINMEE